MSRWMLFSLVGISLLLPGTALARPGCLTGIMRNMPAYANAGAGDRPVAVGYVDSEIYPIRVHYRREGDADRAATVVLPAAEHAWAVEVEQMGWPSPASDGGLGGSEGFDYYMTNDGTYGGAWTWGPSKDVVPDDDWFSVAAFVALDESGITDDDMDEFVDHEFNHALQYTIDGVEETGFVWESTAEAMESLAVQDSTLYFLDIPDFQKLPFESILFDGYSAEIKAYEKYSYYEYGGSIAGLYLEGAFGKNDGTTLLQLWLDMAQGTNAKEPDYVDALGMIGGAAAPTYEDVYLGLAEWRMFANKDDDGAHYEDGARWGRSSKVATEGTLSLSAVDGTSVMPVDAPYDLGTSYWTIEVDDQKGGTLHLELTGDAAAEWGIVATAWLDGAPARVVKQWATSEEVVTADLDLTGATQVMVGVANLGAPDLDAEAKHPRSEFSLAFRRDISEDTGDTAVDTGDTATDTARDDTGRDVAEDTGGKVEQPAACGCQATPAPGLIGLLALGILRRRRERDGD